MNRIEIWLKAMEASEEIRKEGPEDGLQGFPARESYAYDLLLYSETKHGSPQGGSRQAFF